MMPKKGAPPRGPGSGKVMLSGMGERMEIRADSRLERWGSVRETRWVSVKSVGWPSVGYVISVYVQRYGWTALKL